MNDPTAYAYHENHAILFFFPIPDDFGLRSPVVRKPFQTKSASSIVACVVNIRRQTYSGAFALQPETLQGNHYSSATELLGGERGGKVMQNRAISFFFATANGTIMFFFLNGCGGNFFFPWKNTT